MIGAPRLSRSKRVGADRIRGATREFQRAARDWRPRAYTLRLCLERAAARLLPGDDAIVDVALDAGFTGHEVFTLGRVFGYCQQAGLPTEGRPFTRYFSTGPGLWTIEAGPLAR